MKKTIISPLIVFGLILCAFFAIPAIFCRGSSAASQAPAADLDSTKDPRLNHAGVTENTSSVIAGEARQSQKPLYAVVGGQERLTPFPSDTRTANIMKQSQLQREGDNLASHGLYEDAIVKFNQAMDPSILNEDHDKSLSFWYILRIHQRQGRYQLALKELETNTYEANKKKDSYVDKRLELLSLLEWQKTGSPQAVHDHIRYLEERYKDFLPPGRKYEAIFTGGLISTIVHLYNHIGDADGGMEFMGEVLDWRAFHPDQRAEYERVRQAFEDDKRTGTRGHLREALETSSFISW